MSALLFYRKDQSMDYKEFNVGLPIKGNNVKAVEGIVQYDTANIINVRLINETTPFDFTGYTDVIFEVLKPDGTRIVDTEGDNLQILDPAKGMISFILQGQMTLLPGTHYCTITLYANGLKMTTARMNYFVGESIDDINSTGLTSETDYPLLQQMLAQHSLIKEAERERIDAETARKLAEAKREQTISEFVTESEETIATAREYMEQAKAWAEAAQLITLGEPLPVVLQDELKQRLKNINCGEFNEADTDKVVMRHGLDSDLPELSIGEIAITQTGSLYAGLDAGNVLLNGVFAAGAEAPVNKRLLWIDTAHANAVKWYDGAQWQGIATATFG